MLKLTNKEKCLVEEDSIEFVNMQEDICSEFESQSIKTEAAKLVLALDRNIDGMQTFMIDLSLNLLEKIV